jgi:hypothetical protein
MIYPTLPPAPRDWIVSGYVLVLRVILAAIVLFIVGVGLYIRFDPSENLDRPLPPAWCNGHPCPPSTEPGRPVR